MSTAINGWIKKSIAFKYTENGVMKLLKQIGFSYKQTKQDYCESNIALQEKFVHELSVLLISAADNQEVNCFIDVVHPAYNTGNTSGWIKKGSEFKQPAMNGMDPVNINGAINAMVVDEDLVIKWLRVNAQCIKGLYGKLIRKNTESIMIYSTTDNVKYYTDSKLNEWIKNTKIKHVFLPSYLPDLNRIEKLWELLRIAVINKTFFRIIEQFEVVIIFVSDHLKDYKNKLETLMTLNFHISESVNSG